MKKIAIVLFTLIILTSCSGNTNNKEIKLINFEKSKYKESKDFIKTSIESKNIENDILTLEISSMLNCCSGREEESGIEVLKNNIISLNYKGSNICNCIENYRLKYTIEWINDFNDFKYQFNWKDLK